MASPVGFKQDPQEQEFGWGQFHYDDGSSMYGYEPDLAKEVGEYKPPGFEHVASGPAPLPDSRLAANEAALTLDQQHQLLRDFVGEKEGGRSDFDGLTVSTKRDPKPASTRPEQSTKPEVTTQREKSTTPQQTVAEHADGLDPNKLNRVIGFETKGTWDPSIPNPNGVHAGLIQFSKELWPGVAKAAGKPEVTWDQMRQMSVAEQMPFVTSYFKEKGITKDSTLGDYYMAVAAPGLIDAPDERVAYGPGSKAVKQNPSWDLDKDGQITAGELRNVLPDKGGRFDMQSDARRNGAPGEASPAGYMPASYAADGGAPATAPQSGAPPGLAPSKYAVIGQPLTPEQMQERQSNVYNQTMQQMAANQQGGQGRIDALAQKRAELDRQAQEREKDERAQREAAKRIDERIKKPIADIDPGRFIKNMSTGHKILGALAILLSTVGQSITEVATKRPQRNLAIDILLKGIDDDIEAQKENKKGAMAKWESLLGDKKAAEQAAKYEATEAARLRLASHDVSQESAEVQRQVALADQALQEKGQKELDALQENEAAKIRLEYEAPPAGKALTYKQMLEEEQARRALGGATAGSAPEIAPVGDEDQTPEARATIANQFNSENTAHKGQMAALGKEMQQITKLEENLSTLETEYGVRADQNGNYPAYEGNQSKYSSNATGPWYNVADALDPDDPVDRNLKDAWLQVETGTREGWKTEPNGEVKQVELSGIDKAKRDEDVPGKLKDLREEIVRRKEAIMSSTVAPVRAAWKLQNNYPLAGKGGSRAVTGKVSLEDDDGLTETSGASGGW
jgi:hypothetical protein